MPQEAAKEKEPRKRGRKPGVTNKEIDNKHVAYLALINAGMTKSDALRTLGYSDNSTTAIDKAINGKSERIGLLTDKRIKKAYRVIDRFMAGKGIGTVETVKDSTVMRAAEMVIERADPKVQEAGNTNICFTQINLGQFEAKPTEIDVTPIDVPETAVNDPGK
jgi:hypothetical protein